MFEVPWSLENLIDPGYKALMAMTQYWTEIVRDLADSLVIPFDVNDYATVLKLAIDRLDVYLTSKGVPGLLANGVYSTIIDNLNNSTLRFTTAASNLQNKVEAINSGNCHPLLAR
jgi:hypothetical protein